jgi:micrococcal nuclease
MLYETKQSGEKFLKKLLFLAFLLFLTGCFQTPVNQSFFVQRVIDGDTLVLEDNSTVRLIGINAPEKGQPGFDEAKQLLEELVLWKPVKLERDVVDKDRYGRLLRYVTTDVMANAVLLEQGKAFFYPSSNQLHSQELKKAEQKAVTANTGLWTQGSPCLSLAFIVFNPEGPDQKRLGEECIGLSNQCPFALNVTGWVLKDTANNAFSLPARQLNPYDLLEVCTGNGTRKGVVYLNHSTPVWNNQGDRVFVQDEKGLALFHEY